MKYEDGFPTMVYKDGGTHQRPGGTFSYMGVNSPEEMKEAIACGWSDSLEKAANGDSEPVEDTIDEASPPTREELEAKAKDLGIKFTHRSKDKTIADKIAKALS